VVPIHHERCVVMPLHDKQHKRTRDTTIAIGERVDLTEAVMQPRRLDYGMHLRLLVECEPKFYESLHLRFHVFGWTEHPPSSVGEIDPVVLGLPLSLDKLRVEPTPYVDELARRQQTWAINQRGRPKIALADLASARFVVWAR
jgi:hypothetical protein